MNNTLLTANNIKKSFNEGPLNVGVLKGLEFSVNKNETIAIIGSSGSGKSTLLRIILGITSPSKGLIESYNQDLDIAYLGHKNAIKNYLTPIQNLELMLNLILMEVVRNHL